MRTMQLELIESNGIGFYKFAHAHILICICIYRDAHYAVRAD